MLLVPRGACGNPIFRGPGSGTMSGEEGHHPVPRAIASFRTGGHPTATEIVLGGLLMIAGMTIFLTWVATFDAIWCVGIIPFGLGAILMFHSEPILETLQRWKATRRAAA